MGVIPNGDNNFLKNPQIVRHRRPDYGKNKTVMTKQFVGAGI